MRRKTIKSSTIFISIGDRTSVFRSVDEVPPELRKRLEESTTGINSATVLIADRKGRDELIRAIQGAPGSVQFRVTDDANRRRRSIMARRLGQVPRRSIQIALMVGLVICIAVLLFWK